MRILEMDPWRSLTKLFCKVLVLANYIKDYIYMVAVNLVCCRNLQKLILRKYIYIP